MRALDESDLLLDLLREAGDEPVTLDELQVVGVRDPAQALLALELAGHSVHRVYENPRPGRTVTCVRLGAPRATPAPAPVAPRRPCRGRSGSGDRQRVAGPVRPVRAGGPDRRIVLGAVLGILVLLLLARRD